MIVRARSAAQRQLSNPVTIPPLAVPHACPLLAPSGACNWAKAIAEFLRAPVFRHLRRLLRAFIRSSHWASAANGRNSRTRRETRASRNVVSGTELLHTVFAATNCKDDRGTNPHSALPQGRARQHDSTQTRQRCAMPCQKRLRREAARRSVTRRTRSQLLKSEPPTQTRATDNQFRQIQHSTESC